MPIYSRAAVWAMKTGIVSADLNIAWNETPLTSKDLKAIRDVKEYYREDGLPFSWWIFPGGYSEETVGLLREEGFFRTESIPTLLADLRSLPNAERSDENIFVVPVQTKAQLSVWEEVSFAGFDFSPETREQYSRFVQAFSLEQDSPQKFFLGLINQIPVATSLLFLHGRMAGLYFITTLADYRRKGAGQAITKATMQYAKQAQADYVTLQSTPQGRPVYLKAGFEECGQVVLYSLKD